MCHNSAFCLGSLARDEAQAVSRTCRILGDLDGETRDGQDWLPSFCKGSAGVLDDA